MTVDELQQHLDRLGSRLDTWPAPRAAQAHALIDRSEHARAMLRDAQALDEVLRPPPALVVDHGALERRILHNLPERDPWQAVIDWLAISFWRPTVIAALPLLCGFALGFALPQSGEDQFYEDLATLAFDDPFAAYPEFNDE